MLAGEVNLKNWYKPQIDKKILKELSKRSDFKGYVDILFFLFFLFLSGYFCILTWGTWWAPLAFFIYGNIFYSK